MRTLFITFLLLILVATGFTKTAEEWKSRSVYQIITDRFAKTDADSTACSDLTKYCGGTFKGIQNNLDYIQGMGFDAIWISPVVANTPDGYHGYWASDLYSINEKFGTAEELKELTEECHNRDIWIMVDVVANHMGYVDNFDYTEIIPFNDAKYYNPYRSCDDIDYKHQPDVEVCWLSGLPDLDQNHPFVRQTLIEWAKDFVNTYHIDGLRIDTIPHVSKGFWAEFSEAVGVYTLGEVLNMDLHYLAGYQGSVDAVLNYALYSTLNFAFQDNGTMNSIQQYYRDAYETWPDITTLGNFVNNHDNPRYLSKNSELQGFKSALAFSLSSVGIPIVYYGDEQAFSGGQDPLNREALWTDMNADSDIYNYLKTLNQFRKSTEFHLHDQIERYVDDNFYAFSRGNALFTFTNSLETQTRTITDHPYQEGAQICNIFKPDDCVEVKDGEVQVTLVNGEVKIFSPQGNSKESPSCHAQQRLKKNLGTLAKEATFLAQSVLGDADSMLLN